MLKRWLMTCMAGIALLSGCASTIDPKDETLSLVYGYFDMDDAPSNFEWVSIKKYGDDDLWYNARGRKDGLFLHVGVAPGSYQVDAFGGMGGIPLLTRKPYKYNFGNNGRNDTAIRIRAPGVYYMGAYKYVDHPGGFFKQAKFEMKPIPHTSEKEVLQRVISTLESDSGLKMYTHQIDMAKRRMATLK